MLKLFRLSDHTLSIYEMLVAFQNWLFQATDIASLVYFRITFGAIMLWEVGRYLNYGWIKLYWIDPPFHFSYYGFDWVKPLPENGMYVLFVILGVMASFITIGFKYRISAFLFFVGFTYTFLLEQARYINQYYLVCLLSFLLIFLPANRAFSIDALQRPAIYSDTIPAWPIWLLRTQIGIVYFYAAIAKMNSDWLLHAEPMKMWLSSRTDFPLIGQYFTETSMVYLLSYGGFFLDLLVFPCLLWRRTRLIAFVCAVIFHLMNSRLFSIGIFPWIMIASTGLFLAPDFPRSFVKRWWTVRHCNPAPFMKAKYLRWWRVSTCVFLSIYLALQLLIPLRHFLYPGNVNWTYEGHRFSWRMKLLSKQGNVQFIVTDPVGNQTWKFDPQNFLAPWQVCTMAGRPDMILQFSHYIADKMREAGYEKIEVRVQSKLSLNGRNPQLLIDPEVNLVTQRRSLNPSSWIMPLTEILPAKQVKNNSASSLHICEWH
ncbi:HTTM domain-containing protein [Nostoc sp. GT001]|uniref:HTTM domain-containing protein n=1 Tax=Nostoc sp. GT001 TaxID=3056647 RepID=UPI0025AA510D|nr:HTTM domain-containing protein [Nostoc sp. GT001]MDM9580083.1 HTTM domain-containing protein [Nostoc sp. GT001]